MQLSSILSDPSTRSIFSMFCIANKCADGRTPCEKIMTTYGSVKCIHNYYWLNTNIIALAKCSLLTRGVQIAIDQWSWKNIIDPKKEENVILCLLRPFTLSKSLTHEFVKFEFYIRFISCTFQYIHTFIFAS